MVASLAYLALARNKEHHSAMQLPREHGPIAETAWLTPTRIVCVLPSRPPSAILVRAARHASAVRCG